MDVDAIHDPVIRAMMTDAAPPPWIWCELGTLLADLRAMGVEVDAETAVAAAKRVMERHQAPRYTNVDGDYDYDEITPRQRRFHSHAPVVYYARLGSRIKIGTTTQLTPRLRNIGCEQLVGLENGENRVEARRHARFQHQRILGEWFSYEGDLKDYCAALPPHPFARFWV